MGAIHRICETCAYCSFAGNCDRYDKPLTSIEQSACDDYEIHPLLAENAKLRELVRDLVRWQGAEHQPHEELWFWGDKNSGVYARMRELGIEVE